MKITDIGFRTPNDLEISKVSIKKFLLIGSCFFSSLRGHVESIWPETRVDWLPVNHVVNLPDDTPSAIEEYQFQVIHVNPRSIIYDGEFFKFSYLDDAAWQNYYDEVVSRLRLIVERTMKYNLESNLLTFISNFFVPQINTHGRLLKRNQYQNQVYFFEELNRDLEKILASYKNTFLIDNDSIAQSIGKRYILDDSMWSYSYNSIYTHTDYEMDSNRLTEVPHPDSKFQFKGYDFVLEFLNELYASYKTIISSDQIKLVVTDLDDTLWRGVSGEWSRPEITEGWPGGYAEALAILAQRGILLAVISKNDMENTIKKWSSNIPGDLFSILKINWSDKPSNMREILGTLNLLPKNVLFIDDNPTERGRMTSEFPDMRVIGSDPHLFRRILMYSPELQVPVITMESSKKSEMISGQIKRDEARVQAKTPQEFLLSLGLKMTYFEVKDTDTSFQRCLELLNKTNQFNTTGDSWVLSDLINFVDSGGKVLAIECSDKFTSYGIIGIVLIANNSIRQMVLSCRVFGLGIEAAIFGVIKKEFLKDITDIRVIFKDTGRNEYAKNSLSQIGFTFEVNEFTISVDNVFSSAHVEILTP